MLNYAQLLWVGLVCLVPYWVTAQEAIPVQSGKKDIFSIGIQTGLVLNSNERFSTLGNAAVLDKKNLALTSSYDKNGNRNKGIRNVPLGFTLLYRRVNEAGNSWGVEAGYSSESIAFSYENLRVFGYPNPAYEIGAWVNWYKARTVSLALHRVFGSEAGSQRRAKWYTKFRVSYLHMHSFNSQQQDHSEEWINNSNRGAVWDGKFMHRNNWCFTPELGRQLKLGKSRRILLQAGIAYRVGMFDMYDLRYTSVEGNSRTTNSIRINGNYLSLNFSFHLPISTTIVKPRVKKPKQEPAPKIERIYSQNNLVFLLDVSVSMNSGGKLDLLKQYMVSMLDSLPPNDYITIIAFSGATNVLLKPTQIEDKEEIVKSIQNITPHGSTNINRGLETAYQILDDNYVSYGNNRIIIATDGEFKATAKTKEKVTKGYGTKGVKVSILHFIGDNSSPSESLRELTVLGSGNYTMVDENNITRTLEQEYRQKLD